MTSIKVNLEDNPGLKRRLELLNESPIMKELDGLSAEEIAKLPKDKKLAVGQAVANAIKQAQQEESASNNSKNTKGGQNDE